MLKKELELELNRTKVVLDYAKNELQEKDKEIERLKNDKKKILELIENDYFEDGSFENYYEVLNILKEGK